MIEFNPFRHERYIKRNEQAVSEDIDAQNAEFDAFQDRLSECFPGDNRIIWAFQTAREAHGSKNRESGQLYVGHIVAVVSILLYEYEVRDPDVIIAAAIHDLGEDTDKFGKVLIKDMPYENTENKQGWKEMATNEVSPKIGERATALFIALTRPRENGIDI